MNAKLQSLILIATVACRSTPPKEDNNDRDNDGYASAVDCNDEDPTMPAFDQDCDGVSTDLDCNDFDEENSDENKKISYTDTTSAWIDLEKLYEFFNQSENSTPFLTEKLNNNKIVLTTPISKFIQTLPNSSNRAVSPVT